jgi:hypothetical protein
VQPEELLELQVMEHQQVQVIVVLQQQEQLVVPEVHQVPEVQHMLADLLQTMLLQELF